VAADTEPDLTFGVRCTSTSHRDERKRR
jgi:hypothetical protein